MIASSVGSMEGAKERLFMAAVIGDTEVLDQLTVEPIADVIFNERNNQGDLASHVALQHGHRKFAMKICTYFPAALWLRNRTEGDGLLHMAAKLGDCKFFLDGARLLSKHFQGFSSEDKNDQLKRDAKAVKLCSVNNEDKSLLYLAAEKGYVEAAQLLLENKAFSVNRPGRLVLKGPDGSTPLHIATYNRNYDMVRLFLQHVPESTATKEDGSGNTLLHKAVLSKDQELAKMFLDTWPSSADILNKDGLSPFHLAARLNLTEMFKLFVELCRNCCTVISKKGQNALHFAVEGNSDGIISAIIMDENLSELINQQDQDGNTPLHLAAYKDDTKMQNTLLHCKAKVQPLMNSEGLTFQELAKSRKERKQKEKREKMEKQIVDRIKEFQSGLLVMTVLIITVTFTASFTLPGGYNGSQPNQGMATLTGLAGFDVFLVTNTISMSSSIIATTSLILFSVVSTEKQFTAMIVAIGAIVLSIVLMLVAVTAGVWVVVGSQRKWLAISIAVITSSTPPLIIIQVLTVMSGSAIQNLKEYFTEEP